MTDIVERLRYPLFTMLADGKCYMAEADCRRDMNAAAAEIERLRGQVAELELTGTQKELQAMLHQLGLDFESMRHRAIKAEAEIERLRALTCPLGLDNSRTLCSAGSCPGCLADREIERLRTAERCCVDCPYRRHGGR